LLLGGARSGKSDLAVRLGRAWAGPVTVIATAVPDGDADLAARVARHRAERPASWHTQEEPIALEDAVGRVDRSHLVIVDCITVWIAAQLRNGLTEDGADGLATRLAAALAARPAPSVVVSNEVGLGVHPSTVIGGVFRDVLGRANQRLAAHADRTLLLVAGRALPLQDPELLL
jgi:adenosyl cobinamide kinase/adenosyl cobinamide phosphate guanylyltransferase